MNEYRVFMDGDMWCATDSKFTNLQESHAGFGHTPLVALGELIVQNNGCRMTDLVLDLSELKAGTIPEDAVHDLCKPDAIFGMGA